jgi:ABC-type proline/glycine betaine transport system ATPase subunit
VADVSGNLARSSLDIPGDTTVAFTTKVIEQINVSMQQRVEIARVLVNRLYILWPLAYFNSKKDNR